MDNKYITCDDLKHILENLSKITDVLSLGFTAQCMPDYVKGWKDCINMLLETVEEFCN